MFDSTPSGDVVDQGVARTAEPVVERDACGQRQETLGDASAQAGKSASTVTLQGEDVLEGPKDRLDPLADRSEVEAAIGLVFSRRSDDRGFEVGDSFGEVLACIALVADDDLPAVSVGAFKQLDPDLALVALGRGKREGPGGAVGREEPVQAKAPEEMRPGGEDADEPLDRLGQTGSALVEAGLLGQFREEIAKALAGDCQEAAVRGYAHDFLGDAERGDLGVGDSAVSVSGLLRQEIVCRAINDGAENVEVGVHRGLSVDGCFSTVDFGLSALKSSITAFSTPSDNRGRRGRGSDDRAYG